MKKLLTVLFLISTFFVQATNKDEKRIAKLVAPYEKAIEFMTSLDPEYQINDHDISTFFSKNDLYQKKDIKKFNSILRTVKKLTYSKKSLRENRAQLELVIDNLEKVQKFIVDHAATYYALTVYEEIAASYLGIDEQLRAPADFIIQCSDKLGLQDMQQGRGLYKFRKKIDLDLRRLAIVFMQNVISDDLVAKMNQVKIKLITLKKDIIEHPVYKSQLSATRWLKTLGVFIVIGAIAVVPIVLIEGLSEADAMLLGYLAGFCAGEIIIQ